MGTYKTQYFKSKDDYESGKKKVVELIVTIGIDKDVAEKFVYEYLAKRDDEPAEFTIYEFPKAGELEGIIKEDIEKNLKYGWDRKKAEEQALIWAHSYLNS